MEAYHRLSQVPVHKPIVPITRVVDYDPLKHKAHQCYLCDNIAQEPRQCFNSKGLSLCQALFCKDCLLTYLEKKPFCPKCRTLIANEKNFFMMPEVSFYRAHQQELLIKC